MNIKINLRAKKYALSIFVLMIATLLLSFTTDVADPVYRFPFDSAGLTKEQAAAHLISRFTYGATPGQVEEVAKQGLEIWFEKQLNGDLSDAAMSDRLNVYTIQSMDNKTITNTFRKNGQILKMAMAEGVISKDSTGKSKKDYKEELHSYMVAKGFQPERELVRQFVNQKIVRAVYSKNQLHEVMTEFWFNHFNISFTKRNAAPFIPNYERDAIRPNVLADFENLLFATAKSPAMLFYLDNFSSAVEKETTGNQNKRKKGLNENYAREVMELHTLGVDGGYSQNDVTDAARILTGWTVYPMGDEGYGAGVKKMIENIGEEKMKARGFVHDGDFLFTPNRHDKNSKQVLSKTFPAGGGYSEGVELLSMLAHHPATAKFISRKLAVRFVSENPPASLVEKMARTFEKENGNIRRVLITMVSSPEFWEKAALRSKTKSPMELVVSSIRALNANVKQPYQLYQWISRMGQPLYFYQAPTGFPDRDQHWVNTGALLNRMNFGLALADGRIPGVTFDLLALNDNHEPGDANEALNTYTQLIMPERDSEATIKRLTPLLNAPNLQQKIDSAANQDDSKEKNMMVDSLAADDGSEMKNNPEVTYEYKLSQVVGILLGSPEFQRR